MLCGLGANLLDLINNIYALVDRITVEWSARESEPSNNTEIKFIQVDLRAPGIIHLCHYMELTAEHLSHKPIDIFIITRVSAYTPIHWTYFRCAIESAVHTFHAKCTVQMQAKIEFNFTLNTQNMNKESVYLYAYKNVFINSMKTKEWLKIDRRKLQPTQHTKKTTNKRNTKCSQTYEPHESVSVYTRIRRTSVFKLENVLILIISHFVARKMVLTAFTNRFESMNPPNSSGRNVIIVENSLEWFSCVIISMLHLVL